MVDDKTQKAARDAGLMRRLAAGEEAAARELVAAYSGPLARFAAGLLNDASEGEDIAHEAIMRLWRNAADWRPEGAVGGWLRRTAYTLSIDRLRRKARFAADPEAAGLDRAPDERATPEEAAYGRQVGVAVNDAMARLPDRQRAALLLAQVDGLSGNEIAEALETSAEAVESLLARARRTLRAELAETYRDARGDAPGAKRRMA